jgi:hypothetical protein
VVHSALDATSQAVQQRLLHELECAVHLLADTCCCHGEQQTTIAVLSHAVVITTLTLSATANVCIHIYIYAPLQCAAGAASQSYYEATRVSSATSR